MFAYLHLGYRRSRRHDMGQVGSGREDAVCIAAQRSARKLARPWMRLRHTWQRGPPAQISGHCWMRAAPPLAAPGSRTMKRRPRSWEHWQSGARRRQALSRGNVALAVGLQAQHRTSTTLAMGNTSSGRASLATMRGASGRHRVSMRCVRKVVRSCRFST